MEFRYAKTLINLKNVNHNIGGKKEYDENVLDYLKLPNGNYIVKLKKDNGLEGDNDVKNTLPSHLGGFVLSNSKRTK